MTVDSLKKVLYMIVILYKDMRTIQKLNTLITEIFIISENLSKGRVNVLLANSFLGSNKGSKYMRIKSIL